MAEPLNEVIEKAIDKQMLVARDALKEKENVLKEQEAKYHENIAKQVKADPPFRFGFKTYFCLAYRCTLLVPLAYM